MVDEFAALLRQYRVRKVIGDHWGGEFVKEPFRLHGLSYEVADRPKSDLYRDALPLMNSGRVEFLDNPRLVSQLCQLERRVSRAGKDSIDHPAGPAFHDDVANAVSGVLVTAAIPTVPGARFERRNAHLFFLKPLPRATPAVQARSSSARNKSSAHDYFRRHAGQGEASLVAASYVSGNARSSDEKAPRTGLR